MAHDPHVLAPGTAPTPFTAEEIRAGCPTGRAIRVRVVAAGQTSYDRVSRFLDCDESGATLERSQLSVEGDLLGEPETGRVSWRDLQAHASFPVADTTIERERISTAIGEKDCLRYTVREGATVDVFWFATDLPGMPIRIQSRAGGQVVATVSVVSNRV